MRVVLTTFGSLGDLHPYLALAIELKRRGHTPLIATSALYRERIEREGIDFGVVRPDLPTPENAAELAAKVMDARDGPRWLFQQLLMPPLRDSRADLELACADADLLISHPITFAAPLIAQRRGLPWLSTVLSPISLWSMHDPPVPPALPLLGPLAPRLGMGSNKLLFAIARLITRRWLQPIETLRAELGLQRGGHPLFEGGQSPYGTLALFSRALAGPQPDWPQRTTICGFCFYDRDAQVPQSTLSDGLDDDLRNFLEDGDAPIVWTLGSAAVWTARDFWHHSYRAAQMLRRRAVYVVGNRAQWPRDLPTGKDHFVAAYAPYSVLFGRAAAVVHQGGVGTTGQALAAGAPQIIVPFSHDQPDNAARVARLGCGRTLVRGKYTATHAARELQALLHTSKYFDRARSVAATVQNEDGVGTACNVIEEVWATSSKAGTA